jgi:hypothetical protein
MSNGISGSLAVIAIATAWEDRCRWRSGSAVGTTFLGLVIRKGDSMGKRGSRVAAEASCSNVMAEFCPSALLFCSRSHLDTWRARESIGSGAALDVESEAERGRSDWRELVP